jgi:UDP-glucose 4-epimerase
MTSLRDARILLVGGAGLIGSHLTERLLAEDPAEILIYDNFFRGSMDNLEVAIADPRVRIHDMKGDVMQHDVLRHATEGRDVVFHLASLGLLHGVQFPRATWEVGVMGTLNVAEACVAEGVERLVSSSSASVYGDAQVVPMVEEHPYANTTLYGAAKIAGEHLLRAYHHSHGLDYVALRYFNVYGERQDYQGAYMQLVMKVLDRIDQGLAPVINGDGSQCYDFVHVSDIAEANVRAALSDATDDFYNVCTGIGTSLREVVELLLELTGRQDLGIEFGPARPGFVSHRIGSPAKAAEELGFSARVELREGLARLIEWRAAHHHRTRSYAS